jgi:DNA-binding XRE family transcriptional regulator
MTHKWLTDEGNAIVRRWYTPKPGYNGTMLREYRRRRGLTAEQVGQYVGVVATTIRSWERGDYTPPMWARLKLSKLFGWNDQ